MSRCVPGAEFQLGREGDSLCLVTSAQNVGIRETRHFKGLYTMYRRGHRCRAGVRGLDRRPNWFNFDIHNVEGAGLDRNGAQKHFSARGRYTIPYRACVPKKGDGLLFSGRNISGTRKAHSNFRAMPICMNIGQKVGAAAAVAVRDGVEPRHADLGRIQRSLMQQGGLSLRSGGRTPPLCVSIFRKQASGVNFVSFEIEFYH